MHAPTNNFFICLFRQTRTRTFSFPLSLSFSLSLSLSLSLWLSIKRRVAITRRANDPLSPRLVSACYVIPAIGTRILPVSLSPCLFHLDLVSSRGSIARASRSRCWRTSGSERNGGKEKKRERRERTEEGEGGKREEKERERERGRAEREKQGGGGWRERDCAKIGRLPPSKLVGLEELCELFLPVCPPRIYERRVDALATATREVTIQTFRPWKDTGLANRKIRLWTKRLSVRSNATTIPEREQEILESLPRVDERSSARLIPHGLINFTGELTSG